MFSKRTVLIIGAGASQEFGMPLGTTLKANIGSRIKSVDDLRGKALFQQMIKSIGPDRADRLARFGGELSDVISQFDSMDEALNFLFHDDEIVLLGRLAIAYEILLAERGSYLFNALGGVSTFEQCDNSWAGEFFKLAVKDTTLANIAKVFTNVKVVDFNYDRVLPEYLHSSLQRHFSISPEDAAKCVAELKIFHPYGWVGPLGWEGGDPTADFGASNYDLNNVANRIKTYTENPDGAAIGEIRDAINRAQAIIVLGCGFH